MLAEFLFDGVEPVGVRVEESLAEVLEQECVSRLVGEEGGAGDVGGDDGAHLLDVVSELLQALDRKSVV